MTRATSPLDLDTMTKNTQPRLVKTIVVADHFGVSTRTVIRWTDAGVIPVVRLPSGQRRYDLAAVTAAIQNIDHPNRAA